MRNTHTRRRRLMVVLAAMACIGALPQAASAVATTSQGVSSSASSGRVCQVLATASQATSVAPESVGYTGPHVKATIVHFTLSSGAIASERMPPSGWRPATATAAELRYFGLPERPAGGVSLRQWNDEWVRHYTGFGLTTPCAPVMNESAAPWSGDQANSIWSGLVASSSDISEMIGTTEWSSSSSCSVTPNSYTNWVGIGGIGAASNRLMQNGFWASNTSNSGTPYPFFEGIDGNLDTHVSPVTLSGQSSGDEERIATVYQGTYVEFYWHDLTTGVVDPIDVPLFHVGGTDYPVSDFYAGETGEAIDERGTINGTASAMRDYGADIWLAVKVGRNGNTPEIISDFSTTPYYINEGSGLPVYSYSTNFGTSSFEDYWHSCGVVG